MSEHKTLTEALCAFQAEAPTLAKDTVNPHFKSKFTSLDTVVETVRPLLAKHGLTWSAWPCIVDGAPAMRYELAHVSGDVKSETMPLLLSKGDSQGLGSALTYARRYSISAVLNLVADEDDDGNRASGQSAASGQRPAATAQAVNGTERAATAKQRGLMNAKAAEAELAPIDFAHAILKAANQPERDFESQEHAQQFVNRQLDRLPAKLVDKVLAQIGELASGTPA